MRLPGTEWLGWIASLPMLFAHQTTDEVMAFHRFQRMEAMTRPFAIWGQWDYRHYHEAIRRIQCPVLLIAGSKELVHGMGIAELQEDARRIRHAVSRLTATVLLYLHCGAMV